MRGGHAEHDDVDSFVQGGAGAAPLRRAGTCGRAVRAGTCDVVAVATSPQVSQGTADPPPETRRGYSHLGVLIGSIDVVP